MTSEAVRLLGDVWDALGTVRDPELDESIVSLGFVASCDVGAGGHVSVALRLPTYFCAANFAYLMVDDAARAVRAVPGTSVVEVRLDDHFESGAINTGVAHGRSFVETFGAEAHQELDELRATFQRKALLAATDRACRSLLAIGYRPAELAALTLGRAAQHIDVAALRARRADLGLAAAELDPLLVDPDSGRPIGADAVAGHLARARLTRTSMEANGSLCRRLLLERYEEASTPAPVAVAPPAVAVALRRSPLTGSAVG